MCVKGFISSVLNVSAVAVKWCGCMGPLGLRGSVQGRRAEEVKSTPVFCLTSPEGSLGLQLSRQSPLVPASPRPIDFSLMLQLAVHPSLHSAPEHSRWAPKG